MLFRPKNNPNDLHHASGGAIALHRPSPQVACGGRASDQCYCFRSPVPRYTARYCSVLLRKQICSCNSYAIPQLAPCALMKRVPVLAAFVAAMYMLFVVFYSSKVVYYAIALPTPLISERSLRPISAIKRDSGANSVFVGIASKAEAVGAAAKAHDASSIASWCLRMQKEGDMIARSFDGGARFNFDACFIVCSRPLEVIPLRIQPGNLGKNECWGEKGSRTFLSRFIDIQVKLAASSSYDSASRVIIDAGCNKGDYVAELSPLLSSGALGATKMPDVIYHGFEAMPQNCKFIEQVSRFIIVFCTL